MNTRFASFDIKVTRLGFENACRIARHALRCQQAFSKPRLINLISKDTHLVFSISKVGAISDTVINVYVLVQNDRLSPIYVSLV